MKCQEIRGGRGFVSPWATRMAGWEKQGMKNPLASVEGLTLGKQKLLHSCPLLPHRVASLLWGDLWDTGSLLLCTCPTTDMVG